MWTRARDRRFPQLAKWFNAAVADDRVLVCDLVVLELVRLAPNERRAREVAARLDAFTSIPMPPALWHRAREVQLLLSATNDHRRVPPADLLLAVAAEAAGAALIHYDHDYPRIAGVSQLEQRWFVPEGSLGPRAQTSSR